MYRSKWFFHPLFVFIFSILALGASLFLYIYWYIEVSEGLKSVIKKFNLDSAQVFTSQTWVVILVLSILVGIILVGIFTIFVYNQKILQLYRLQHNFINNFTHELKTPVTSLKLYLETFLKYELDADTRLKCVQYMLSDVGRLSSNITRILNLAKIESKNYKGDFIGSNLVETIENIVEKNRHLCAAARVEISHPDSGPYYYPIDVSLFDMLIMNLMTNAIIYNKAPEPFIQIRFVQKRKKLHIEFRDNGIGFENSESRKIFKKFYQVGRADNMTAKGSGLGLYLVQCIARIHKAKITAESEGEGLGAVFTLSMPLARVN